MRVLLDTHCWLWMVAAPDRFTPEARERLESPKTDLYLSSASVWEIVIKHALGRLHLPTRPAEYLPSRVVATRTTPLPVEHGHALRVGELPPLHRDPFDRMLVAQAQVEGLPILTADPQLAAYDVEILRA
jgi:PIN domain nuclease of toxin-antitoxin system